MTEQNTEEFQATPLDTMFGDGDAETPVTEPASAEPEPAAEADTTGDETPAEPEPDATPVSDEQEAPEGGWTKEAYLAEKRKRQEYEQRLQAYEQEQQRQQLLAQQLAQQPQPDPQADDDLWFDDPRTAAEQQAASLRGEMQSQMFQTKFGISEDFMKSQHDDYDATIGLFEQALGGNAGHPLAIEFANHPNPAKFAYDKGKQLQVMQEIGPDPVAYREKIEAEILEKMKAEQTNQTAQTPSPAATAPLSLASVPSAPAGQTVKWDGPTPLENFFDE